MRGMSFLGAVVVLSMVASAVAEEGRQVRITAAVANVRSAPSATAKVVFQLHAGDLARLVETSEQWYGIETTDGRKGYVFHRLGTVIEPPPPVVAAPPPPPVAAAPPTPTLGIQHDAIGCVVAGLYPKVDACVAPPESVGRAEIHFRAGENEPWYGVGLAADGPCLSAFLPKPQRTTTEFQYYVSAVDRSFSEHVKPDAGPASPYRVRVVRRDRDCGSLARLAYSAGKVVKPIVVAVVRDPAGRAIAAGALEAMAAQALLAGFAQEGVILASSAAASAGSAAGASAAGAGGGGGAGGGIGASTIAIAAGGVVAAAVVVKAVAGGGGDSGPSNSGGGGGGGVAPTPTPTPTPATSLTGNWAGTTSGTGRATGGGFDITVNCTNTLSGPLQHTGNVLTGRLTYGRWACNPSDGDDFLPPAGTTVEVNGTTTSNGEINVAVPSAAGCGNLQFRGTYTSTTISFDSSFQCNIEGFNVTGMEMVRLTKQ